MSAKAECCARYLPQCKKENGKLKTKGSRMALMESALRERER